MVHITLVRTPFGWGLYESETDEGTYFVGTVPVLFQGQHVGSADLFSWFEDTASTGLAVDLERLTGAREQFADIDGFFLGRRRWRNGRPGDVLAANARRFAPRAKRRSRKKTGRGNEIH